MTNHQMMPCSWFVWNTLLLTGSVIYSYGAETQVPVSGLTSIPDYNNNEDYPSYNDDYPDRDYPGPNYDQGDGRDGRSLDGGEIPDPTTDDNLLKQLESTIPGIPGVDYPMYQSVPETSFRCESQRNPGFYGDVEAQCQVFHICQEDDRHDSFLCPIGTVFNQMNFICDWWFNFKCTDTPTFFHLNTNFYTPSGSVTPGSVGLRETVKKMRRFRETNRNMPPTMKFHSSSDNDRKKIQEMTEKRMKNMDLNRIMNLFSTKMRSGNIWKRLRTTTPGQMDGGLMAATSYDTADFKNEDIKSLGSTDLFDITSEHLMNLFPTTAASMETLTQSFPPELTLRLTNSATTPDESDVSVRENTSNPAPTFNELLANGTVVSSEHANTTSLDKNEIDIVFTIPTITDLNTNSTLPTDTTEENFNLIFTSLDLNRENSTGILMSFPEEMKDIHNTESMNDQLIMDHLSTSTPTSISSTNPQMTLSLNSSTAGNTSLSFGNDTHISVSVTIRATAGISRLKWKRIPESMKRKNLTTQNTPVRSLNSENNDSLMDLVFRKRMMRNKKLKSRIMWIPAKNDTLKRKSHWRIFVNSRPQTIRTGDTGELQYQKMDLIKNTIAPLQIINDASDENSNLKSNVIHVDETVLPDFEDLPSTTLKMENTELAFTVIVPSESSILNSSHILKINVNDSIANHRQDKNQDGMFEDGQEIIRGEKVGDNHENTSAESIEDTQDVNQSEKFENSRDNYQGEKFGYNKDNNQSEMLISTHNPNEREKFRDSLESNQREKIEGSQNNNQSEKFSSSQKLNEREKLGNNQSEMYEDIQGNDQGEKLDLSGSVGKQNCKKICIKLLRSLGGTDVENNRGRIKSVVQSKHNSTKVGNQSRFDTDMKAQFRRSSLGASVSDQWSVKYDPGPKCDENDEDGKILVKGWSVIIDAGSVTKEKTVKRRGCDNIFNDSKIIVMKNLTPYHKTPSKKNYPEADRKSNLRFGSMDQQYWLTLVRNWLEASPNSEMKTDHYEKSTNRFPKDVRFRSNSKESPENFQRDHFLQTNTKGNENNFQFKKDNSWENIHNSDKNAPQQHFTSQRNSADLYNSATNKQINTRNSKFDTSRNLYSINGRQAGPNAQRQVSANNFNQGAVLRRNAWSDTGTKWAWRNDRDSDVMTSQSDRNEWHVNIEDKNQNDKSDRRSRGNEGNLSDNWKNERVPLPRDSTSNWPPTSIDGDVSFTPRNPRNNAYDWSSSETNKNSFSKPTNDDWSSNDKLDDSYSSSKQPSYNGGRSLGSNEDKDISQQNSNPNWKNDNVRGKRDWDSQQQNRNRDKSPTNRGDGQASKNSWSSGNRPSNKGNDNSDWSSQPDNRNRWSSDSDESRSFPVTPKNNAWSSGNNDYKSEAATKNARYPIDTRIMMDWSSQSRNDDLSPQSGGDNDWSSSNKRSDDGWPSKSNSGSNWSSTKDRNKDVPTPLDKFGQDTSQNPRSWPKADKESWPSPDEKNKKSSWNSGDQKPSRDWNSKASNEKRDWSSSNKGDTTWSSKDQQEKSDLPSDSKPDKVWSSRDQQEKAGWSSGTKKDIDWSSGDQQEKTDWSSGTKTDKAWSSGDQQEKSDWSSSNKNNDRDWSTSSRTDGRKQLPNYPQSKGDGASSPRNGKDQFPGNRKGTENKGAISQDKKQWPLNTQKDISDLSFDNSKPKIDDWSSKHQKDEPVWGSNKKNRPSSVKKPDDDWFVDNGRDESWSSSNARTDESNRRRPDTKRDKNDWDLSSRKDKDNWSDSEPKLSAENWKDDKMPNKQGGNSDWSSESRSGSPTGFDEDNANWSSDSFRNNPDWSSSSKGGHIPPVLSKGSTRTQDKGNWNSGSKNPKDNVPSNSGFQNPTWSTSIDKSFGPSFGKSDTQSKTKQWNTDSKGSSRNPPVITSDWSSKSKGVSTTSQGKGYDKTPGRQSSWSNDDSQSSLTYPLNRRDEMNLNWSWDSDSRTDSKNNDPKFDESSGTDSAYEDNWSSKPTGNKMSKTNKGDWSSESTSNRMSKTDDSDWSSDTKSGWSSEPTRNRMPKKKDWSSNTPRNPTENRKSKTNTGSTSDWSYDSPTRSVMKGQNNDGLWNSKGRTKTAMVMPTNSKGSFGMQPTKPWKDEDDQPKNVKNMKGDASMKDDKIVWSLQISSNGKLENGWVPITLRPNLKKPNNQTRNQNNDKGSPKNTTDWSGVIQQMDRWGDEELSKKTPSPPFKMDVITETIPSSSQMPDASDSHPFYIPLVNRRYKRESKRIFLTKNNIRPRQAAYRIYKVKKTGKDNETEEDHRFYLARADILVEDNISGKENPTIGSGIKKTLKNLFRLQNKYNETIQNSVPSLIRIKGIRNSMKRKNSALTHSDVSEEYVKKENSAIRNLGRSEGNLKKENSAIRYVYKSENQKENLTSGNVDGLQGIEREKSSLGNIDRSQDLREGNSTIKHVDRPKEDLIPKKSYSINNIPEENLKREASDFQSVELKIPEKDRMWDSLMEESETKELWSSPFDASNVPESGWIPLFKVNKVSNNLPSANASNIEKNITHPVYAIHSAINPNTFNETETEVLQDSKFSKPQSNHSLPNGTVHNNHTTELLELLPKQFPTRNFTIDIDKYEDQSNSEQEMKVGNKTLRIIPFSDIMKQLRRNESSRHETEIEEISSDESARDEWNIPITAAPKMYALKLLNASEMQNRNLSSSWTFTKGTPKGREAWIMVKSTDGNESMSIHNKTSTDGHNRSGSVTQRNNTLYRIIVGNRTRQWDPTEDNKGQENSSSKNKSSPLVGNKFSFDLKNWHTESSWTPLIRAIGSVTTKKVDNGKSRSSTDG